MIEPKKGDPYFITDTSYNKIEIYMVLIGILPIALWIFGIRDIHGEFRISFYEFFDQSERFLFRKSNVIGRKIVYSGIRNSLSNPVSSLVPHCTSEISDWEFVKKNLSLKEDL